MPSNRTRLSRRSSIRPEAIAWARSEDGRRFFEDKEFARSDNIYRLHPTLGLAPWETSAYCAWYEPPPADQSDGMDSSYARVRALLEQLHAIYKEANR